MRQQHIKIIENPHLQYLSTITPVYRGAQTLPQLVRELEKLKNNLVRLDCPVRIAESIFVDDGSTDGSDQVLVDLGNNREWVRIISLAKNFGQHPATMAGILHASGDWVVTLDEDLQHRPEQIVDLLEVAVKQRLDVVYAEPIQPVHESGFRDQSSRLFKWLIAKVSGNEHVRVFNSFRIMRGSIARAASAVAGHQTYFDLAITWFTSRIGTKSLQLKDDRYIEEKVSGYRIRSLLTHARKMLLSSNIKVLRLGALLGVGAVSASLITSLYIVAIRLLSPEVAAISGWASVMVAVLFMGGLVALLVGLLLENMSILLLQSHGQPTFFEVDRTRDEEVSAWFIERASHTETV